MARTGCLGKVAKIDATGKYLVNDMNKSSAEKQSVHPSATQPDGRSGSPSVLRPSRYDDWNVLAALGRIGGKLVKILEREGISTIAELRRWLNEVDVATVPAFGKASYSRLKSFLATLEAEGHEGLVFGGSTPTSISGLMQRFLAQLKDDERVVFEFRYIKGLTLEEVADHLHQEYGKRRLTRERIRQILNRSLEAFRPSWESRIHELLQPIAEEFAEQGGIVLTPTILARGGGIALWHLQLACDIADVPWLFEIIPGLSTSLSREFFHDLRKTLRSELDAALADSMQVSAVRDVLQEYGLHIPTENLGDFTQLLFNITIDGDTAYLNRRIIQHLYLSELLAAGRPISANELARMVAKKYGLETVSPRNAVAHIRRQGQAYSYGPGLWIHADLLPVSGEELKALAESALPFVKAASENGRSTSVALILKKFINENRAPPELTAHVLRDALIYTGKVRGYWAGTEVSWRGESVELKLITDWIDEISARKKEPFHFTELLADVAAESGFQEASILVQVFEYDGLLPLGAGQYIARSRVFKSDKEFKEACQTLLRYVSTHSLVSCLNPNLRVPGLEALSSKYGNQLLWGLASQIQSLKTRAPGRLIWNRSLGDTLWEVIGPDFLSKYPICRPVDFRHYLNEHYGLEDESTQRLFMDGSKEGHIRSLLRGWYISTALSLKQQLDLLDAQPGLLQLIFESPDSIRDSKSKELLEALYSRRKGGGV